MGIYNWAYKKLQGTGIGNNILVIKLKNYLDAPKLQEPIKVNGYLLYEGKTDVLGLLHNSVYEPETTKLIRKYSKGIGLDLGANIGYFTLLMAQKCKKVYAFEPSKYTFGLLKQNIILNNCKNIIRECAAVGDREETKLLSINSTDIGSNSFLSQSNREAEVEIVAVLRLDDYFKDLDQPDIIKMDVEGWEYEAIMGGKTVFKNAKIIVFENNSSRLTQKGLKPDAIINLFKDMGFDLKEYGPKKTDDRYYIGVKDGNILKSI